MYKITPTSQKRLLFFYCWCQCISRAPRSTRSSREITEKSNDGFKSLKSKTILKSHALSETANKFLLLIYK